MNWFQNLLYGFISGFAEFLPISSQAHQKILLKLFGVDSADPVCLLIIHAAVLLSVYTGLRSVLDQIRRGQKLKTYNRRAYSLSHNLMDLRLIKNAAVPLAIGLLFFSYIFRNEENLPLIALFCLINGALLYLPERMVKGNKDARAMSHFDSLLLGITGAFSVFPGISRVGVIISISLARGADRQKALNWALLLSVPAIITLIVLDIFSIFALADTIAFWSSLLGYFLSAIGAYIGGYLGIVLMKFLTIRTGYSGFAYYSWGVALFTFMLYLAVV